MTLHTSVSPSQAAVPVQAEQALWVTRCPVPTATGLALAEGWFEAEFERDGWAIRTLQETNDPALRRQHVRHELKGLFREGGNVPAFWARASGLHNTAIVGLTWIDERQVLLSVPGSGLRGPHGLKGARLGLPNGKGESTDIWRAMALRGYTSTLKLAGLTVDDVTLVDIDAGAWDDFSRPRTGGTWSAASEQALLSGEVDVIYAKGAPAEVLRKRHDLDVVFDLNAHPDPKVRINNGTPRPLTVDLDFLAERPDVVARYLAVLLSASAWASTRPAETRLIVARETNTDVDSVLAAYGTELHRSLDITLSDERIAAFEDQKAFLRDWKLIPGDVDIASWIDRRPLAEAERLVRSGEVGSNALFVV